MADLKTTCDDLYAECRNILPGMSVEQTKQIEAAIKAGNFLEAASVVQTFKNLSGFEFNIAVTGESRSGKSSLINAIQGLADEDKDEGAPETSVLKKTKEPVPYWHPMCSIVIVWELPSIETPDFRPDAYLKEVKFSRYDVFIIIASERSKFCLTELAQKLTSMGKKSYFVRSKVDLDLFNEKHKKSFSEERTLDKIRNDCVNNLSRIGMSSSQVFLVSNREFQKYDSPQLQKTLLKDLYHRKLETIRATEAPSSSGKMANLKPTGGELYAEYRNILPGISAEKIKQIDTAIKTGNFLEAASVVQTFKNLSGIEFNIAITGESGSGKSSLVNAIRGLGNEDEGAAETPVVEMTKEPVPYCHPTCSIMIIWDLPSIRSTDFQPDTYLKQVKFSRYDVFLIIASERSRFCHIKLAQEIQKMGKKFFFVRSKVDLDLYDEESKERVNEKRTLDKIRNDCVNNLSRVGMSSPQVFLVSNWEFKKYDSPQLQKTLLKELYDHKPKMFRATEAPSSSSYLRNSAVSRKRIQDDSSVTDLASSVSGQCSVNPVSTRSLSQEKRTSSYFRNTNVWRKGIQDGFSVTDLASSDSGQCSVNPVCSRSLSQEKKTPSYLRNSATWRKGIQDDSSVTDLASPVSGQCSVNPVRTRSLSQEKRTSRIMEYSKAHWSDFFSKRSSKLPGLSEEENEKFQTAVKAGNLSEAMSVVKMSDDLLRNTTLNIAITGNSGSGKSSFINAIRSLNDDDGGSAKTGVTETTKDPTAYPHPIHRNVIVWDLPGIGTTKYPAKTYLKDVHFDRYDLFIIITAGRFTEADTKLAKEINSMGKKFYFVRTKVDVDLVNERRKRDFNEENTLKAIRSDCMEQLQKAGISSPQVFLVSRWDFHKYDYPQLQETLANDLKTHKRHILICALPSTSEKILKEKKKALQEQIWKQALKSCALAAVPLPFLSVKCDVDILVENMKEYCKSFGLDGDSLQSLAKQVGKSELKSVIQCALAKDITREEALKRLREATGERMMTVKYFISVVPLIGTGIAAERSYRVTYEMLHTFLDEVAEDAQRVLKKALGGAENNQ